MKIDLDLYKSSDNLWGNLAEKLSKYDANEIEEVKRAFDFAYKYHLGQKRDSGDDYITHSAWVAKVTAQLGIGKHAVMAALLHDIVEDTNITVDDVAREFDDEVALLVDGVTDVKNITRNVEVTQEKVEVFRKLIFSSVEDVRVLIIRIVDKLHNLYTIGYLSEERQKRYAERVMEIYGPLSEYVGLHFFKRLLDDMAFEVLYPEECQIVKILISKLELDEKRALIVAKREIKILLMINRIADYEIQGRIKGLFSTYLKTKKVGENRVKDRVGLRIITDKVSTCYTILGLLHSKYPYLPEEFDDYISKPKPSGYRSIQTTLNWKNKLTLEVQIRTREMHEYNEFGPASHIAYKASKNIRANGMGYEWVRELVKWQKGDDDINNYRIKVLENYIYVLTPKGDTIQMPKGSTALDFAYRIHQEIGNHCVGALINNKMGKISDVLKSGDLVEIKTSKKIQRKTNGLK